MSEESVAGLVDIAVLDDDMDFRNYIEDLLRDEGKYAVRSFAQPEDLFAAAENSIPDIVLLDMKMGAASGEQVLEQLLARWPELCVIVITGYPSLESMRATFKLRVFDYLAKPFSIAQLRQALQNAIEHFGLGRIPQDFARAARAQNQAASCRARLVAERPGCRHPAERFADQLHRAGANLPSVESLLAICRAFDRKPSDVLLSIGF